MVQYEYVPLIDIKALMCPAIFAPWIVTIDVACVVMITTYTSNNYCNIS